MLRAFIVALPPANERDQCIELSLRTLDVKNLNIGVLPYREKIVAIIDFLSLFLIDNLTTDDHGIGVTPSVKNLGDTRGILAIEHFLKRLVEKLQFNLFLPVPTYESYLHY